MEPARRVRVRAPAGVEVSVAPGAAKVWARARAKVKEWARTGAKVKAKEWAGAEVPGAVKVNI
jgi:hypothetical protein